MGGKFEMGVLFRCKPMDSKMADIFFTMLLDAGQRRNLFSTIFVKGG
jgi:hypothetical protein